MTAFWQVMVGETQQRGVQARILGDNQGLAKAYQSGNPDP